jgi:hypothetical protein
VYHVAYQCLGWLCRFLELAIAPKRTKEGNRDFLSSGLKPPPLSKDISSRSRESFHNGNDRLGQLTIL